MKPAFFILCAALCVPATPKNSGDDSLRYHLERTELVVLGTISREPVAVSSELGVIDYQLSVRISDVLRGDPALAQQEIRVNCKRFESDPKDKHPLIARNEECILFLKGRGGVPKWTTTDMWFGLQYPSPAMARALKRLSHE